MLHSIILCNFVVALCTYISDYFFVMKHLLYICTLCLALMLGISAQGETLDSYGNEFVAVSNFHPGEGCMVIGLFAETNVTLSSGEQFVLHRGERHWISVEHWIDKDGIRTPSLYIYADEPIQVRHTTSFGETYVSALLPALTCETLNEQHFTFPQKISKPKLLLITPANQIFGFTLDGKVLKMNDSYAVSGNEDWAYTVIDLGTRKAGSTLTISAPHNHYLAAVIGNTYEYLAPCELEARVTIDTIFGAKVNELVVDKNQYAEGSEYSYDFETSEYDKYLEAYEDSLKNVQPRDSDSHHRAALYLQGAYAAMPLKMPGYSTSIGLGYGAAAGVLYEYQHKHFLMQAGAGFYWLDHGTNILNQPAPHRKDRTLFGGVEVPLLFGQNFQSVYYLLGVKMCVNVMMVEKSSCEPCQPSPHQIMAPIEREQKLFGTQCLMLDPRASIEFGFNLGQERHDWVHSRLAFFADWGFYAENLSRAIVYDEPGPVSTVVGEETDYATYELTHFLNLSESNGSAGCFLHHLQAGLKFTLLLGK